MYINQSSIHLPMARFTSRILTLLLMGLCQIAASASLRMHTESVPVGDVRTAPMKNGAQSRIAAQSDGISGTFMCNAFSEDTYSYNSEEYLNDYYVWSWGGYSGIEFGEGQTVLSYNARRAQRYFYFMAYGAPLEAIKIYLDASRTNDATIRVECDGTDTPVTTDYVNGVVYWKPEPTVAYKDVYFYMGSGVLNVIGFEIYSQGNTPDDFFGSSDTGVVAPVFRPTSCTFADPMAVEILAEEGTDIYFSTTGDVPSVTDGNKYNGPVVISSTTTFKAIAVDADGNSSRVSTATYTCTRHGIGEGYNPASPGDPGSESGQPQEKTYHLTVVANPTGAGSVSAYSYDLKAGDRTYVYTYSNSGFVFKNWTIEGTEVSTSSVQY